MPNQGHISTSRGSGAEIGGRALAEVNPQLIVKRHRGARAALDKARSILCVQHPSLTHGHMKIWRLQVPQHPNNNL